MLTTTKSADSTYLIYVPYSCRPTYNFVVHPPGSCRILKRSLTRTGIGHDEFGDAPLVWSGLTIPLRGGLGDSFLLANEIYRRNQINAFRWQARTLTIYKTQVYAFLLRIVKACSILIRRLNELYFELNVNVNGDLGVTFFEMSWKLRWNVVKWSLIDSYARLYHELVHPITVIFTSMLIQELQIEISHM